MGQVYGGGPLPRTEVRKPKAKSQKPKAFLMLADGVGDGADDRIDRIEDFLDLGMSVELLLGKDQFVSDGDLEHPAARRDDGHVIDVMLELAEDCFNHAHGTVCVASRGAVLN